MRDKINKFMQGRYGVDQFARFTLGVELFLVVIGSFMRRIAVGRILHVTVKIRNTWHRHRNCAADLTGKRV